MERSRFEKTFAPIRISSSASFVWLSYWNRKADAISSFGALLGESLEFGAVVVVGCFHCGSILEIRLIGSAAVPPVLPYWELIASLSSANHELQKLERDAHPR